MFRSLAIVGILTIIGVAGTWSAIGQDETGQTSTGVVAKNHITDAERDRLMRKAMEDARVELEKQKAATQAQEDQKAEIKRRSAEAEALAAEAREEARQDKAAEDKIAQQERASAQADKAAADKKAEEERLAAKLAEDEKKSSAKATAQAQAESKSDVKNLDQVKPENSEKTDSKNASVATSSKDGKNKPDSNSDDKKSYYTDAPKKEVAPEKTVIETVSTKEPGSGLSVKTTMPTGDAERKAEQAAARSRSGQPGSESSRESESSRQSLSGQVVGMMRSSNGMPRILLNTEGRGMVQVVMEDSGEEMPAPGAMVSVKGREIGGGNGRPVISAQSISITSGERMQGPPQPADMPETVVTQHVEEARMALPGGPIVMPPPMGMMHPPMGGMIHGPGIGIGIGIGPGGPMFGGPHHPF